MNHHAERVRQEARLLGFSLSLSLWLVHPSTALMESSQYFSLFVLYTNIQHYVEMNHLDILIYRRNPFENHPKLTLNKLLYINI